MAKSKVIDEMEIMVANILDPNPDIEPESDRQWSWSETSRFQLTGQYPEWYTPPNPVDVQPTNET